MIAQGMPDACGKNCARTVARMRQTHLKTDSSASSLDKDEFRRAITALRKTAFIQGIAPLEDGQENPWRYELTGKMLGRHKPPEPFATAASGSSFDKLLTA